MALNVVILSVLQQMKARLPVGAKLCCLGYPDVLLSQEQALAILGPETVAKLRYRPDSAEILKWHGLTTIDRVIDADSLFAAMDIEFTAVDIVASRGTERIVDLNEAIPADLAGVFDVVLDAGTMEHCFNVGRAIKNIVEMTKVGGFTIHLNPMAMLNHGFFNFSPTFYHDFYTQNGHTLQAPIHTVSVQGINVSTTELHPTGRQKMDTPNAMVMCVARKKHDRPLIWPMQSKYLSNPTLKATDG